MSYLPISNNKFADDLLNRKEFYMLAESIKDNDDKSYYPKDEYDHQVLTYQSHQLFARNYLLPQSPYKRILVKYGAGIGKTLTALAIANEYIPYYKKEYLVKGESPSVYVIGFTSENIKKEILKFPELGFVSRRELYKLKQLEDKIETGNPIYKKRYTELYSKVKSRITKKKEGGFYRFYGYQELVNKFIYN